MLPSFAVWSLVAPLAFVAVGPQTGPSDLGPGTALELALTERTCSVGVYFADADTHEQCMSAQLAALRADLGRDLQRLSLSERQSFDAACGRLNTAVTREAYLDCLNGRILARRGRLDPISEQAPAKASPVPASHAPEPRSPESSGWRSVLVAAGIAVLAAAAGVVLVVWKRPLPRTCEACKQPLSETADLCAECRRAAADAVRHANEEIAVQKANDVLAASS